MAHSIFPYMKILHFPVPKKACNGIFMLQSFFVSSFAPGAIGALRGRERHDGIQLSIRAINEIGWRWKGMKKLFIDERWRRGYFAKRDFHRVESAEFLVWIHPPDTPYMVSAMEYPVGKLHDLPDPQPANTSHVISVME